GQLHAARGEYESALREYRQALRLHPLANGAYSALGTIVQGQTGVKEALRQLESLVGYRLGFGDTLLAVANLRARAGDFDGGVAALQQAIIWDRLGIQYYNALAAQELAIGRLEAAAAGYTKVLGLKVDNMHSYLGLGQVAMARGEIEAGEGFILRARQVAPYD